MNRFTFMGWATERPELRTYGKTSLARIRLIRNDFIGMDEDGKRKEMETSITFTAFGNIAKVLCKTVMTGDQILVEARVRNNDYEAEGRKRYGFNFEILNFEYGAPGRAKRERNADEGPGRANREQNADEGPGKAKRERYAEQFAVRALKKRSDYLQNYLNTVEIYAPGTVERWVAEGEYEAVKAIVGRGQNPEHFSREILLAGEKAAIDAARREADANGGGLSP